MSVCTAETKVASVSVFRGGGPTATTTIITTGAHNTEDCCFCFREALYTSPYSLPLSTSAVRLID